ncbi:unnamed protein product [Gordionus sp. m RMFG-2023]|uniref:RNA-binding protein 25-like n=1 Tax=Gordionus sp. m RMFG-2023 TaxID=3053472 RepID=UPI0030E4D904
MSFPNQAHMIPQMSYMMPPGMSMMPMNIMQGVYVPPPSMGFPGQMPNMNQPMQSYVYPTARPTLTPLPVVSLPILEKLPAPSLIKSNPTTTVFVGNINEKAPDMLVRNILSKIGNIISWKRVQGVGGKLQAFGFCEFDDPEATLRSIRLLHTFDLGGKKLMVKVDAKSKEKLREYRLNKRKDGGSLNNSGDSKAETDEEIFKPDVNAVKRDNNILHEIKKLIKENAHEFVKTAEDELQATKEKLNKTQKIGNIALDEEKTDVISKEILRFKENNMKDEKFREKMREKGREKRERERQLKGSPSESKEEGVDKEKKPSVMRRYRPSRSRSGSRKRHRAREASAEKEKRERKSASVNKEEKEAAEKARELREQKERERIRLAEEEREKTYERRKLERKLREKEASYQEQLRGWETRESKKLREHRKQKQYEEYLKEEELTEAKRLKEFLEDYLDDRDDAKYYKGSFLARRLKEREKEMEMDLKDRQKEKEEIEEIKARLRTECHPNLELEMAKLEKSRSQHLKPQLRIDNENRGKNSVQSSPVILPPLSKRSSKKSSREEKKKRHKRKRNTETRGDSMEVVVKIEENHKAVANHNDISTPSSPETKEQNHTNFVAIKSEIIIEADTVKSTGDSNTAVVETTTCYKPIGFKSLQLGKNKANVDNVFGEEETDSKKKLIPLDDDTQSITLDQSNVLPNPNASPDSANQNSTTGAVSALTLEEKRQSIKRLIEKIPTNKTKLFAYNIQWDLVDNILMEKRIKPWINKKIVEYIGEEELTLVDFICSKLLNNNSPQSILDDILMVLDEEAEVFVVKLWRLLIYEIEAKKAGLLKME